MAWLHQVRNIVANRISFLYNYGRTCIDDVIRGIMKWMQESLFFSKSKDYQEAVELIKNECPQCLNRAGDKREG